MIPESTRGGRHLARPRRKNEPNVGPMERVLSAGAGLSLARSGFRRGGLLGWLAASGGALLMLHGLQRHSRVYEALGVTGEDATMGSHPLSRQIHSRSTITILAPPGRVYRTWRDVSGLHRFFPHVDKVEELDATTSRWTGVLIPGQTLEWEGVIQEDNEGEHISWRSFERGILRQVGSITFEPAPRDRGTRVTLELRTRIPGGVIGAAAARMLAADPSTEAQEALRRLKQWVETGQIASAVSPAARDEGWARSSIREEVFLAEPARSPAMAGRAVPAQADQVDEASMDSFPASDPPAFVGRSWGSPEKRRERKKERERAQKSERVEAKEGEREEAQEKED